LNCKEVIRELSNFLDGEMDASLVAEVERHLSHCEHCQLVVDTTRRTIQLFCNSQPAELPEDVRGRLHAALEKKLRNT
jgi:anti-sigma factor (TIGR02949 family)